MSRLSGNLRINIFLGLILLASSLILYRLFVLSVVNHSAYSRTAQAQSENIVNILARGNIYLSDKNETFLAATNKKFPLAYVVPADIKEDDKPGAAEVLVGVLEVSPDDIKLKMSGQSSSLKVLARRISAQQVDAIKSLGVKGVGVSYESDRFYPADNLASGVIGFLGYDAEGKRSGQYGIEEYYNQNLFGRSLTPKGLLATADKIFFKSVSRWFNPEEDSGDESPGRSNPGGIDRPADLILTIDKNIQELAEEKLKKILERWGAESGTIIVQDPESGKILAMAGLPDFNPNLYSDSKTSHFLNMAIQEVYEPGSSFKPVTVAAGLDLSKITPQTSYEDKGFVNEGGYTIHNFSNRVFGVKTMTEVLENSINTGTMHIENLVGDENFLNYVINMGFGQRGGIDLPGELSGDITNLYSGRKINYLTASFGQGISVTPLQLVNAYSAIANGGKLMRPYVVDRIISEGGDEKITQPEIISIPISEKTALKLQSMLISVVDNGFDKARIKGYDVAGKTGTAQMPDGRGGYSETDFIHNFVGFAPAYNAKFVILIKIDKPRGIQFAADSLSPVFKEMAEFLLNYYRIPPTRNN